MTRSFVLLGLLLGGCAATSTPPPAVAVAPIAPPTLLDRIAGIQKFAAAEGGKLWPGLEAAPFGFLLIEADKETLYCRQPIPANFAQLIEKPGIDCPAASRPRSNLPPDRLAAMPLFGPPSTIVMGTPEATGRDEADWTRTILHEHFHQWQDALPDIYPRMAALDLAGGDETGMWVINFPFPYEDAKVGAAASAAALKLQAALAARGTASFKPALREYLTARAAFAATAGERNWRYAEMQLWKEGVARWTEIELGKRHPDAAMRQSAEALEGKTVAALAELSLAKSGREFVYPYGAAEAMLLEACGSGWRAAYPTQLALGPLLNRCG